MSISQAFGVSLLVVLTTGTVEAGGGAYSATVLS